MKIDKKRTLKIFLLSVFLFACFCYWDIVKLLFGRLIGAITPIIVGFAIAYVLNILMSFFERHYFVKKATSHIVAKTKRPVCLLAAIFTFIIIVTVIVMLVVPELMACLRLLAEEIPPVIERAVNSRFFAEVMPKNVLRTLTEVDWKQNMGNVVNVITNSLGNATMAVITALTSVISVVVTLFLSIVFAIYFLVSKEKLQNHMKIFAKAYIPKDYIDRILEILNVTDECFHNFIVGQCTEALILGVMCALGMVVFNLPYAAMVSVVISITALIPIAGAYVGACIGAVMIFSVSPVKAVLFLLFIIILQQIEGNFIYPKVVGKSVGLPAFYVIAAITIGGGICGVAGMLLGVPITATIYRLVKDDVEKRERKINNESKDTVKKESSDKG